MAKLDTQSYWLSDRRPAKRDTAADSLPPHPAPLEETPMDHPADHPADHPMNELLRLAQQQVTLLARLTEALPAPNPAVRVTAPPTAGTTPAPASPAVPADEAPTPPPTGDLDEVTDAVLAHVARISAFPVGHLRKDQLLIDELGFDSLMLTDLFTSLKRQWPRWTFDETTADRPTVASIAALIAGGSHDAAPAAFPAQRADREEEAPPRRPPSRSPPPPLRFPKSTRGSSASRRSPPTASASPPSPGWGCPIRTSSSTRAV